MKILNEESRVLLLLVRVEIRLLGRRSGAVMDHHVLWSFRMMLQLLQRRIPVGPTVRMLMLLVRMMVVVMQLGWILHAGVDVLVSVIDRHVAVLQTRIALAGVDGRHLVTVRVVTVAASVSGCVRSGCVAPRDAVMTVAHFPVQFRFGFLHGVDRQRMRKSPLRAQRVVGSWARLIPKAVAG